MSKITQITSLTGNGLSDFIIQRVTAYILAVYTVVLVGYMVFMGDITYAAWKGLFDQTWMQIFTFLAILSTCAHAWIGMWTVGTDYIREHYFGPGATGIRLFYQVFCIITLVIYLIWSVKVLWGN